MSRTITRQVSQVHELEAVITTAEERLDAAWAEIEPAMRQAALRRGRRKNMELSAAAKARIHKFCRKAALLELAGILDEDDALLLGVFLAVAEVIKDPARRDSWMRRGQIKLLKKAKGVSPDLVIRFAEVPPAFVREKLDDDGFEYDPKSKSWLGQGDLEYGRQLVEFAGVGGKAMASPAQKSGARP
jgi:hypothetical protein